jgi:putative ABC transport system permease protein
MFRRRRSQRDFNAEVEAHIALEAARLRSQGFSDADAESAAHRAFGNVTAAGERFYEADRWLWWDEMRKDFRYAVRSLAHNPVFTGAAVLTLALGIGANAAIFTMVDAALLRPLPYPHSERLVMLEERTSTGDTDTLSPAMYLDFRRMDSSFAYLAAFRGSSFNLTGGDRPERVRGTTVTPDFFAVLGVEARFGRTLNALQDKPGSPRTVVLSDALWERRYGGNPAIIGRTIQIDGEAPTVVGVMPPYFQYPPMSGFWMPARYAVPDYPLRPTVDQSNRRDTHYFDVVGRLKAGITAAGAKAQADTIAHRLQQRYGDGEEMVNADLEPLRDDLVGETRPALLVLLGAVALLLLIACANVANILLARGATRQKEIAIRGALGAGRGRLVRQFLTESLTLGVAGGVAGIALAYLALPAIRALLPADALAGLPFALDARVLAFATALSVVSAILFGMVPAFQAARFDLNAVLKQGGRDSASGSRARRVRGALVVGEVALAGVLLIGAGLLVRSFDRLLAVPEGFEPAHVLSLQLALPNAQYPDPASRARFVRSLVDRIDALPGVAGAAAITRLPLNPGNSTRSVDIKGRVSSPNDIAPDYITVSPDYFRAMGIAVLAGRAFTDRDDADSAPVAIVSRAMARYFWPGRNPVGRWLVTDLGGRPNVSCRVVGVVADVRQHGLAENARAALYVPYADDAWPQMSFVVRARTDPAAAASAVVAAVHSLDQSEPVYNVRTMPDVVAESLAPRRFRMLLIGSFAFAALALALVGIYGVIAYSVAQRRQEIGIRIALGAGGGDVLRTILGDALRLSLAGAAAGVILSLALTRFLSNMLYGIRPADPATFLAVCALLIAAALAAGAIPALRATRVDPLTSLRAQ